MGWRWVGDWCWCYSSWPVVFLVEKISNLYVFCFTTGFWCFFVVVAVYQVFFVFEKMFKKNNRKRVCVDGQLPKGPKEGNNSNKTKTKVQKPGRFKLIPFNERNGTFESKIQMDLCLPKDHWTLKTGYFEDPTPAIQVQTLPLEGPRSLGPIQKKRKG